MISDEVAKLINRNKALHVIIENEVTKTPYGTITVNVEVVDGQAILQSANIVKNKRRRYKQGKGDD